MINLGVNVAVIEDGRVLLTQREDFEVWCLPGGQVESGESLAQAAAREVREETGTTVDEQERLGEVSYWYRRNGRRIHKTVHFFLCRYVSGDTADHDHEVDDARWIPMRDADRLLTYPAERRLAELALSKIRPDR